MGPISPLGDALDGLAGINNPNEEYFIGDHEIFYLLVNEYKQAGDPRFSVINLSGIFLFFSAITVLPPINFTLITGAPI